MMRTKNADHRATPEITAACGIGTTATAHVTGVSPTDTAYTVAHAYQQLRADLTDGTALTPDFAHAVRRHRLLDRIQRAAATGQRVTLD